MSPMSPACKRFYPVAVMIQNVVAHSRTKKSGHARDPHARPHTRDPSFFYRLVVPFRKRSELGGPRFLSQFACGDGPARTSVSANSKFVKILYELIGKELVLYELTELRVRFCTNYSHVPN